MNGLRFNKNYKFNRTININRWMKIEDITNYVTNKFKMQITIKVIVKFVIVPKKCNYVKTIKYEN